MKINKFKLDEIRKRHNLLLILLHGSHVSGKVHVKSDVDIAIVRKDDRQKLKLLELIKDLSATLETDKIDVSDLTHADPLFLYSVVIKSKLLSGEKNNYDALLRLAFHKYSDYLPYLEKERELVIEKIKSYVTN